MDATLLSVGGGGCAPPIFVSPQATTVPSDLRARLKRSPAATATTPDRPLGTSIGPPVPEGTSFEPQAATLPSLALTAKQCLGPAAIADATSPAGTLFIPNETAPHARTVPFALRAIPLNQPAATVFTFAVAGSVRLAGRALTIADPF